MPSAMIHLQEKLQIQKQPIICYNGALILIDHKFVHSTTIPIEIIEALHTFNSNQNIHLSLYNTNDWFVPAMDYWALREARNTKVDPQVQPTEKVIKQWKNENKGAHKMMCMGEEKYIDEAYQFLNSNFSDQLHLYRSKPTYIEIANKSISKLTAIEYLLQTYFDTPIEDVVAFGDNYNDIEMLKAVGTGVAVGNAKPETKEVADVITLAGKEDGVAKYIKNNIKLSC